MMRLWPIILLALLSGAAGAVDTIPATTGDETITVATYNVLHHTDTFVDDVKSLVWDTPRPTDRITPTLDLLAHLNADIIALQEVTTALITAIREDARMNTWYVTSTLPQANRGWRRHLAAAARYLLGIQPLGQAILSKWPITDVRTYPMGRPLLVTDITLDGLTLTVATCHLDSFPENQQKRIWQLKQIFPQLGSAQHAILLGDFNFDDDRPENAALNPGYLDVWQHLYPQKPGDTFGFRNKLDKDSPAVEKRRLDRILLRSQQLTVDGAALFGTVPVNYKGNKIHLSDHYGVIAYLHLTGP